MAHKRCIKAEDMAFVLFEFTINTRKICEREADSEEMDSYAMLDYVFDRWNKLLDEYNIQPENLVE